MAPATDGTEGTGRTSQGAEAYLWYVEHPEARNRRRQRGELRPHPKEEAMSHTLAVVRRRPQQEAAEICGLGKAAGSIHPADRSAVTYDLGPCAREVGFLHRPDIASTLDDYHSVCVERGGPSPEPTLGGCNRVFFT